MGKILKTLFRACQAFSFLGGSYNASMVVPHEVHFDNNESAAPEAEENKDDQIQSYDPPTIQNSTLNGVKFKLLPSPLCTPISGTST